MMMNEKSVAIKDLTRYFSIEGYTETDHQIWF
jgi:hypothetical protein